MAPPRTQTFQPTATPAGGGWSSPKRPLRIVRNCPRAGCNGTCPLATIARLHKTDKPATCRVCGRRYPLPPGTADLLAGQGTQVLPKQDETAALKKEVAQLRRELASAQPLPPASPDVPSASKPSAAELEARLEQAKQWGDPRIISLCQAELDAAKSAANESSDSALKKVLGKLSQANAHASQMASNVVKDTERLSNTQLKAQEAAKQVALLEKERDRLFLKQGHVPEKAALLKAPEHLSSGDKLLYDSVISEVLALAKEKLAVAIPSLSQTSGLLEEDSKAMEVELLEQQAKADKEALEQADSAKAVKKLKGSEGAPVASVSEGALPPTPLNAAPLSPEEREKQDELDGEFKRGRSSPVRTPLDDPTSALVSTGDPDLLAYARTGASDDPPGFRESLGGDLSNDAKVAKVLDGLLASARAAEKAGGDDNFL